MSNSTSPAHATDTDRHVKIYLNILNRVKSCLRAEKQKDEKVKALDKPLWLSSWTNLNLLNLSEILSIHGPLRNIYGGLDLGKGIIKEVKPHIRSLTPGWEMAASKTFLQRKTIDHLLEDYRVRWKWSPKMFKKYKTKKHVMATLFAGKPVLCVWMKERGFGFILRTGKFLLFRFTDTYVSRMGLCYRPIKCLKKEKYSKKSETPGHYVVLLPLLGEVGGNSFSYACVTSEYLTLHRDGQFGLPRFPSAVYQNTSCFDEDSIGEAMLV
jgi:hypothetical protein